MHWNSAPVVCGRGATAALCKGSCGRGGIANRTIQQQTLDKSTAFRSERLSKRTTLNSACNAKYCCCPRMHVQGARKGTRTACQVHTCNGLLQLGQKQPDKFVHSVLQLEVRATAILPSVQGSSDDIFGLLRQYLALGKLLQWWCCMQRNNRQAGRHTM